ncbi:hypothetical protein SERLADRAFT_440396 [Serpula lacrymans var. lacrymans S7.9]|uniref:Uncharacterized protein n=1 Tax=Serpula lacrymans var. lacrymans (strain S7.9) TaxID=578457 RepID=F8P2J2_SERL9|nr:uncharacterized protein SERLADRAFT_440396 [Serpula lacrymans var. lacrymans S7.9]EGO22377.1 hypothetical protein SERLADRAFT_440396 [Serpula lacrymans var. lacrymans S7.9]
MSRAKKQRASGPTLAPIAKRLLSTRMNPNVQPDQGASGNVMDVEEDSSAGPRDSSDNKGGDDKTG